MLLSITDAAKYLKVTRQAVYVALKKGHRLRASKPANRWQIHIEDLQEYQHTRYNRKYSKFKGEPLYADGEYSPRTAAMKLGVPQQKIYYALRCKKIPATRKGSAWVINEKDLDLAKLAKRKRREKIQELYQQAG